MEENRLPKVIGNQRLTDAEKLQYSCLLTSSVRCESVNRESSNIENTEDTVSSLRSESSEGKTVSNTIGGEVSDALDSGLNQSGMESMEHERGSADVTEVLLINWAKVWEELSHELATHTSAECTTADIKMIPCNREGNRVCHLYQCQKCPWNAKIWTTPKDDKSLDINEALILGGVNSGAGYSQMKKIFTAAGVKFMNNQTYQDRREKAWCIMNKALQESMEQAGREEFAEAEKSGDVENGMGKITVLADGSWMKRSYRTGTYDSPAGMAYIIGAKTGKILWVEIKDMYCSTCDRAAKANKVPKRHTCFKNWSRNESSTSMESAAIVEGFKKSIEQHKLMYVLLIADGDSSVYKKILEADPYGAYGVLVQKVECSKHLRRAFQNKVKDVAKNKRGRIGKARVIVKESGHKCIKEVNRLLQSVWDSKAEINDKCISEVAEAIDVIPRHVFGDHSLCKECNPICDGIPNPKEINQVGNLQRWNFVDEVETAISRLSANAKSLLLNLDTNMVEAANGIVAEKIGGKRVNFALRNEYHIRVLAAALQFNTRNVAVAYYKTSEKEVPTATQELHDASTRYHQQRNANGTKKRNRRKKQFSDKDYGKNAEKPDKNKETYDNDVEEYRKKVKRMMDNRDELERETRGQCQNSKWQVVRRSFVTASVASTICRKKEHTSCSTIVRGIRIPKLLTTPAIMWGNKNEVKAKEKLETVVNDKVLECGLFLHPTIAGLAASPDGILEKSGNIVEIKCPYSAMECTSLTEAYKAKVKAIATLFTDSTCLTVRENHAYYYQVQMQLHVVGKDVCYFFVWIPADYRLVEIKRNDEFWNNKMLPKLSLFYSTCLLPEIVDSRLSRGMQIREPIHIVEAKEKNRAKVQGKKNVPKSQENSGSVESENIANKEQRNVDSIGTDEQSNNVNAEAVDLQNQNPKKRRADGDLLNDTDQFDTEFNDMENCEINDMSLRKSTRSTQQPARLADYVQNYTTESSSDNLESENGQKEESSCNGATMTSNLEELMDTSCPLSPVRDIEREGLSKNVNDEPKQMEKFGSRVSPMKRNKRNIKRPKRLNDYV